MDRFGNLLIFMLFGEMKRRSPARTPSVVSDIIRTDEAPI